MRMGVERIPDEEEWTSKGGTQKSYSSSESESESEKDGEADSEPDSDAETVRRSGRLSLCVVDEVEVSDSGSEGEGGRLEDSEELGGSIHSTERLSESEVSSLQLVEYSKEKLEDMVVSESASEANKSGGTESLTSASS